MKRIVLLVAIVTVLMASFAPGASAIGAQRPNENASCTGFLNNAANPNAAYVLHNLVFPTVGQGASFGQFQADIAQQHSGDLLSCIPFDEP